MWYFILIGLILFLIYKMVLLPIEERITRLEDYVFYNSEEESDNEQDNNKQ